MKKFFYLASAVAVLAACSNNDELPASAEQPEAAVFDLVKANWWQLFTADLMSATSFDWLNSSKHKDSGNRLAIKTRMTLK